MQPGVIKGFVPNHEIDLTGVSAEDSRISRHFGKFVGTLGALAVLAAAFALLRVARRRVQPLIAAKVSELRQAETPPAQDEHFIRALDELDNGTMDRAMWARSIAATGGDNQKARADYISRRATQLAAT